MKKLKYILFIFLTIILYPTVVFAETTSNGVTIEENASENDNTFRLYCEYYSGDYIVIDRAETGENGNIESSFSLFDEASDATLKQYGFMHDDGKLDCPLYIYGSGPGTIDQVVGFTNDYSTIQSGYVNYGLNKGTSICEGKCTGNQNSFENDFWSCNYTGPSGSLTMKYDGLYLIYFPDGYIKEYDAQVGDDMSIFSPYCGDMLVHKTTHEIKKVGFDYAQSLNTNNNNFDLNQYDYFCGPEKDNYEYFCNNGNCLYPENANIDCDKMKELVNKKSENKNQAESSNARCDSIFGGKFGEFLSDIYSLIKFAVPIIIIVLAIVDFIKAMASQDQAEIKKAANKLVKRLIIGVAIFILPTILEFILKIAGVEYGVCNIK